MPTAGAGDFAIIYKGWNVWAVYQVNDLSFELGSVGLDRERRLRIWVEDAVRLGAVGATVADPLDLKGGQVAILPSEPAGLAVVQRKEGVGGDSALTVKGPAEIRYVRFFNRGSESRLVWPHDSDYLLDRTYQPSPTADATRGPAPPTIGGGIADSVEPLTSGITNTLLLIGAVGIIAIIASRR